MKTLLINSPQTFFPGAAAIEASVPIGLLYIAAALENARLEVHIIDAMVTTYALRKEGEKLQIGLPWNRLQDEIRRQSPDIVGINNPFTTQIDNAIRVAEITKEVNPKTLTVIGGPHVSVRPVETLEEVKSIDIVVIGEGEYTIVEIVKCMLRGTSFADIKGIAYRKNGEIIKTLPREPILDLDKLPFPAYHLVDMEKYLTPKNIKYRMCRFKRELPMITSRGCPFNCNFCSVQQHMSRRWRAHSKEYIHNHIRQVIDKYQVQHLHFEDDNIALETKRFNDIINGLLASDRKVTWDTPNGIRADCLTPDLLDKIKQSGCVELTIAVESSDQYILDTVIGKQLRLDDVINTARLCKQKKLKLSAFYVIGFPGERLENMKKTTGFALMMKRKYGVNFSLFIATPLYGTRLYEQCLSKGYLTHPLTPRALAQATQAWGKGLIKTENFTPNQVSQIAARTLRARNLLMIIDGFKHPIWALRMAVTFRREVVNFLKFIIRFKQR
ncbi:MAG: cobalamin-dependent protein [Candidatus Omnitrophota bacterium]